MLSKTAFFARLSIFLVYFLNFFAVLTSVINIKNTSEELTQHEAGIESIKRCLKLIENVRIIMQSHKYCSFQSVIIVSLGLVVQSTISANPGFNFNLLFWFMHFCSSVCFKTLKKIKVLFTQNVFCGKTCSTS